MFSEHILTNHDSLCLKFALIVENYPIFIVISGYTVNHTHTHSVIHSPHNFGWWILAKFSLVLGLALSGSRKTRNCANKNLK